MPHRTTLLHRRVNLAIAEAARAGQQGDVDEDAEWRFACECGRPDCTAEINLSLADFAAIRAHGSFAVAPHHTDGALALAPHASFIEVAIAELSAATAGRSNCPGSRQPPVPGSQTAIVGSVVTGRCAVCGLTYRLAGDGLLPTHEEFEERPAAA